MTGIAVEKVVRIADKWKVDRLVGNYLEIGKALSASFRVCCGIDFPQHRNPGPRRSTQIDRQKALSEISMQIVFGAVDAMIPGGWKDFLSALRKGYDADISLVHVCPGAVK